MGAGTATTKDRRKQQPHCNVAGQDDQDFLDFLACQSVGVDKISRAKTHRSEKEQRLEENSSQEAWRRTAQHCGPRRGERRTKIHKDHK